MAIHSIFVVILISLGLMQMVASQGLAIAQPQCPLVLCAQCVPTQFAAAGTAQSAVIGGTGQCPGCPSCNGGGGPNPPTNICAMVLCAPNCRPAHPINPTSASQCCICTPTDISPG
ncbi:uncharacterized protein LOC129586448 [Paramacrobiotus metropolitanus]|uniref:uncharacterized protein LOC129586448 n=1 Tax=Paramacrobiotus metropolitanus TaxID=2943436 RepID=UPI00244625A8|nr:uncharacterized protein LOC129586448 [Paramacrobiotus metropolitanus]